MAKSITHALHLVNPTPAEPKPVRILPPHVVNRIAAGEVIERPASVLKELVENALDAGSTKLEITVALDGQSLCVADNGQGMSPEDAQLAFLNHATSKLQELDDLETLGTLGFRGEALASISSVSRLTCLTRTASAAHGTKVVIEGGSRPDISPVGCGQGTLMRVDDLFFNTPVRLKFLKRPQTEVAHMEEMLQGLALSHPHTAFTLVTNEKLNFATQPLPPAEDPRLTPWPALRQTVKSVLGLSEADANQLLCAEFEDPVEGFKLTALLASPASTQLHKRSRKAWWQLLNGRLLRCPILTRAVQAAFEGLVPPGVYPLCVLWLELPTQAVDVNVHPTKREVRYANSQTVFQFVRQGLLKALTQQFHHSMGLQQPTTACEDDACQSVMTPPSLANWPNLPMERMTPYSPSPLAAESTGSPLQQGLSLYAATAPEATASLNEAAATSPLQVRRWRVIGQLFYTYILLETPKGLMVVDQHIASERWCYEHLVNQLERSSPVVQPLLTPLPLHTLEPSLLDTLAEHAALLASLGFSCQQHPYDGRWALHSVPLLYPDKASALSPLQQLQHLLQQLAEAGTAELNTELLLATMACHMAIRAGDTLTLAQMERLVVDWLACTMAWSCPHGRPIAHTIAPEELNHFFERPSLPANSVAQVG
jgi:DNA mismatch repair protein MutL